MTALVEQSDIEAALVRPLTTNESTYIAPLIAQASSKLRTAMPTVDRRLEAWATDPETPGALDPKTVSSMLAGVIKRVLVNPRGTWSRSQSSGPFSESETYPAQRGGDAANQSPGGLVITADDLAQLNPVSLFVAAGTIRTPMPCLDAVYPTVGWVPAGG